MAKIPDYAELRCVSNFSFLRGASPGDDRISIGADASAQREDQREGVLGNCVDCIVPDVADHDAKLTACLQVDVGGPGCRNGDHSQIARALEDLTRDSH